MSYWDFVTILTTKININARQTGKPVVQEGLYQSQKDMIEKRKQQRK